MILLEIIVKILYNGNIGEIEVKVKCNLLFLPRSK